jgi:hypothetical protein
MYTERQVGGSPNSAGFEFGKEFRISKRNGKLFLFKILFFWEKGWKALTISE